MVRFTVPANLLLCGEYAVTEPGGSGVACAPDLRLECRMGQASFFSYTGITPSEYLRWDGQEQNGGLPEAVASACRTFLPSGRLPAVAIVVDSTTFFDSSGRKLGLGSSAAVAVALAAALYHAASGKTVFPETVCNAALSGHRAWQGGGSGYDVLTSFHGGCGLFTGGEEPGWEALPWHPEWHLALVRGPASQSSRSAAGFYRQWRENFPDDHRRFMTESENAVGAFADAVRAGTLSPAHWEIVREKGTVLGRKIGVPADDPVLLKRLAAVIPPGGAGKASGAGSELGVAFGGENGYPFVRDDDPDVTGVSVSTEGIRWLQ